MNNQEILQECCRQIELRMGWGNSAEWQRADFEALSARIQDETGVLLSVSTLKRVWGKVKYDSLPSLTTLNTLAKFAGFGGWREAKRQLSAGEDDGAEAPDVMDAPAQEEEVVETTAAGATQNKPRRKVRPVWLAAACMVMLLGGWLVFRGPAGQPARAKGIYTFSMEPLAQGIPNSVVFHYDARAAGNDSVFFQQSWDPRRRVAVPANGNVYTSIYYYPGHFKAKLIVGKEIVKEQNLLVRSGGWLTAVEQEPVPVYYPASATIANGAWRLSVPQLQERNIALQPQPPITKLYYIDHLKGLSADDFTFESALRNEYVQGSAICGGVRVILHGTEGAHIVPLGMPGCVGDMFLMLGDTTFHAGSANLSGFGCNVAQWVNLKLEVKGRQARVFIDGKEAFRHTYRRPAGELVGVSFRFDGTGAVDSVAFRRNDGEVVFSEGF